MRSRWLGCLLVLAACGDSVDDPFANPPAGPDSGAPLVAPVTLGGGTTGGTTPGTGVVQNPVTTPDAGPAVVQMPQGGGSGLPCDIEKIFVEKCKDCHGNPPGPGPQSLLTWADLQGDSKEKPGTKMIARIKEKLVDTMLPMPPAGRAQLTPAEKTALTTYLTSGAPKSTTACTTTAATTPDAGTPVAPVPGSTKCDDRMEMLAHNGQTEGDTAPFNVTKNGDIYEIFWFKPKWGTQKVHAYSVDPIIDNKTMLHHWLLYMKQDGSEKGGSHNPDSGLQSGDSQLLSGWAPGNKGYVQPGNVGLWLPNGPNSILGIELHYNTTANPTTRLDRSGASICYGKVREHEAGTHWLGTEIIVPIIANPAVGTCTVPVVSHLIAMSPHMHKTGKYMKSIVKRKAGGMVTITDQPFDFNDQQIFPVADPSGEIVLQPGDVITTTCDYSAPATFGPGTADEMCYNFVVAWPNGSLSTGPGLVGGKNTCMN